MTESRTSAPSSEPASSPVSEHPEIERIVFFSDAVVAIAMTLLVLPLLESVNEPDLHTLGDWWEHNQRKVVAFVVSFGVSAVFWLSHHRLFHHLKRYDRVVLILSMLWLLPMVLLQVPTAMVYSYDMDRPLIAFYIGTMLAASGVLSLLTHHAWRHPELCATPVPAAAVRPSWIQTAIFAVSLVLALIFPSLGYLWLFLLVLTGPLNSLLRRFADRS